MAGMRSRIAAAAAAVFCLAPLAWAQEQGFTNRATELRERGAPDAKAIANLPEGAEVRVLERAGGWTRVEAGGQRGWVRVFHLRFPATAQAASPSSSGPNLLGSLTAALGGGRDTARGATVATTGIRGLSPEDLKSASPDPAALAKLQSYRADRAAAERFAREGKLASVALDEGGKR